MSNIIWIILIGFVAGLIARMLSPGQNDPKGFILTAHLRKAFFAPSSISPRLAETGSLNSTAPNCGTRSASAQASVTDCVDRPSGWRLVGEPAARLPRVGQREARSLPERWPAVPAAGRTFRTVQGHRLALEG